MKRRNGSAHPSSSVWRLTPRTPAAETVDEGLLGTVDVNLDDDLAAAENMDARLGARTDAGEADRGASSHGRLHDFDMNEFEDTVPGAYVVTPTEP